MDLIIVAGLPATGKTTLAKKIASRLHLPVLEKDEIKEELFDTVGFDGREGRLTLDRAANAILLRCADALLAGGNSLIMVNNFDRDAAGRVQELIVRTGCRCVLVFLGGDGDVLHQRYVDRDLRKARHPGHAAILRYPIRPGDPPPQQVTRQYFYQRYEQSGMGEFSLDVPRVDVDATYPDAVDPDAVVRQIRAALE